MSRLGQAALGAALDGSDAKTVEVSLFLSAGWGWDIPFLPPLRPSRDRQDFLHSPPLPTASRGWNSPLSSPCQLRDLSCSVGSPRFPPQLVPEGSEEPNRFSSGVFSPATGLIAPRLRAEGGGWVCHPGPKGLKSPRVPAAVALSPPCPGAAKRGLR